MKGQETITATKDELYHHIKECFIHRFYTGGIHEWNGIMDFAKMVAYNFKKKDVCDEEYEARIRKGIENIKKETDKKLKEEVDKALNEKVKNMSVWDFFRLRKKIKNNID